jgi:hypothetical protein
MASPVLTRRASLLLPMLLAACGGGGSDRTFPPLRYGYLTPLRLNVASVRIEQRYVPAGVPPDVSQQDPAPPVQALQNMATDRLQAFGSSGQAVFVIQDASLLRQNDTITGRLAVELDIYTSANTRAGFAEARVSRTHNGDVDDLPATLYDMTKQMMDSMNVEFEFQLRRSLRDWLVTGGAAQVPVQQQPLTQQPLPNQPPVPTQLAPTQQPPPPPQPLPVRP